jgi:alanine-glyoxylate transaminase/serine-glyoxylate transaminase/serine-pyruvate transaminase
MSGVMKDRAFESQPRALHTGRHFLQIPGPTNVPDRILRAMAQPVIDHRGPEFARISLEVLHGIRDVFQTTGPVIIYPSSGSGAAEAAYVNTLCAGDRVLICETGWFSQVPWKRVAERLGLLVDYASGTWRRGASPEDVEARLTEDKPHAIKAVVVVHNETSTGVTSRIADIRAAMDRARHPALLIVDAISSLGSIEYRHDEWQVDVTVSCAQKGLMLPPGLGFTAISEKALAAARSASLPRAYFDWQEMLSANRSGFFPYTPATNLLYALREALLMLHEEGLPAVFTRHAKHASATRAAVRAWGLEILCQEPSEYSNVLTAVVMPDGHNADELRRTILDAYDMSLGTGLGQLAGKVFRIGHLGAFNDLMLVGTLGGIEMGLCLAGVPHREGGVLAAMKELAPASRVESAPVVG